MGSQRDLTDLEPDDETPKTKGGSSRRNQSRGKGLSDAGLRKKLNDCLERIADTLEVREDEELSALIREDADVIAAGLVSLTRPFQVLRVPLLALVAVVEPALAFGRIGRILLGRWADRRAARAQARTEAEGQPEVPEWENSVEPIQHPS